MVAVTRFRGIVAVLALAAAFGVVLLASPRAQAQSVPDVTVHIEITATGFVPQSIEVRPGWAVQWTNNSEVNHVVTSSDDDADFVFDTGLLEPGESGAFVFDLEGSFEYFSVTQPNFTGVVIVNQGSGSTPESPTATVPAATATNTPSAPSTPAPSPTAGPTQQPSTPSPSTPAPSTPAPSTPAPGSTATPTPTVAAPAATPPPPAAGSGGLNAIGGGSPALAGILLGMAVMALAAASLFYSGSLGRIGIEAPGTRNRRK